MSNKIYELKPVSKEPSKAALEVLEKLREKIMSGEVISFAAVGIGPDDSTYGFTSSGVTRLTMMGAIAHLQSAFHSGELDEVDE